MINRELIRLKVVQLVYSLNQREMENMQAAENELLLSMSSAYCLYQHLLLLLVEMYRLAQMNDEVRRARAKRLGLATPPESNFLKNRFIQQLSSNKQLLSYRDEQRTNWYDHEEFVRNLLTEIEGSDLFADYEAQAETTYEIDRSFWRQLYRKFICNNERLDDLLEDQNLYWNDDKVIVDTFVDKTIARFREDEGDDMPLLPDYNCDEDKKFALVLLSESLKQQQSNLQLIESTNRNWEMSRIALMDRVILCVGLAEIISFPDIPVAVTITEYVEIAKAYSTLKSSKYIHATLDTISKQMMTENKLIKH